MTATDPDLREIAENVLKETTRELALGSEEHPQQVRDLARDYGAAVTEVLDAGDQLKRDLSELREKRDLLPSQGWERLHGQALKEAQERHTSADHRAGKILEQLRDALVDAAQPVLDPAREQLARQELALLIGDAERGNAAQRLIKLANSANREALAVALGTSFGQTLLQTRGLKGREYADVIKSARAVSAGRAVEHGTTMREKLAGSALPRIGGLGAARGAAGSYYLNVVRYGR